MYLNELDQTEVLARRLLAGPRYGDGHRILSYIRFQSGSGIDARLHASFAAFAHLIDGEERARTSDYVLLAQAAWKVGDFMASLDAADEALRLARRLGDPRNEVAAHLIRADALLRMGDTRSAAETLTSAQARAKAPCDVAWSHLKKGMCQMEAGQEGLAQVELELAEQVNGWCGSRQISASAPLNQAWLLRRKDPLRAREILDQITKAEGESVETLLLRAYLAADRGALEEADIHLTKAAVLESPDADWPWEIARAHAELFELRGGQLDDRLAERHYRRATAMVASLRGSARGRSAYLVASHRGPYDGLIALLARSGRWRDVLAVVLELDASDMLRATAGEVVTHDEASLEPSAPAASPIAPPPPTVDDVLAAWRSRDLVIVIAPGQRQIGSGAERAYRLRVSHGEVMGEDVGDAGTARRWAESLFADPGDRDAAKGLATMIVPLGGGDETLDVLGIGPLGKVPLAALRAADGSPSISRRPLARVLALQATSPDASGMGSPVVIANPRGDLLWAAVEGSIVAGVLGHGVPVAGSGRLVPATRDRLWAARDAAVLGVAAHVVSRGQRRALRLADGDIDPAEMVRARLAPRLAVLASCGSAAAKDEEGWGSIAAALLESGTVAVLATDRSVGDVASLFIMRDFYAQPDWRVDPARALARVQRALDASAATSATSAAQPRSWAAFSVLRRPPVVRASSR